MNISQTNVEAAMPNGADTLVSLEMVRRGKLKGCVKA